MSDVEIRCPANFGRLFMRMKLNGDSPHYVEGNLMEFACDDCKRQHRKAGDAVLRVLHRYDFLGSLVETEIVYGDHPGRVIPAADSR